MCCVWVLDRLVANTICFVDFRASPELPADAWPRECAALVVPFLAVWITQISSLLSLAQRCVGDNPFGLLPKEPWHTHLLPLLVTSFVAH